MWDYIRPIWIDALCINQDNLEERSSQVALMNKVYSRAYIAIIWLGEPENEILSKWKKCVAAHNFIEDVRRKYHNRTGRK